MALAFDLSTAALAVMTAGTMGNHNVINDPVYRQCIAAALRVVADRVTPEDYSSYTGHSEWDGAMETRNDAIREAILAIAAELEGVQ